MGASSKKARVADSPLALARRGKETPTLIKWPNTDLDVAIIVLTGDEVEACHLSAYKRFVEDHGIKPEAVACTALIDAHQEEVYLQLLHRACRDPKDLSKTFAMDADDLRANTTLDERRLVVGYYNAHCEIYNPEPSKLTDEEVDAVLSAAKKGERHRLLGFGPHVLATCLLTMAARQST